MSSTQILSQNHSLSLRVLALAAVFLMAISWPAAAQEEDPFSFSFDEDELFGGEEMITVTDTADAPDPLADILATETLRIGGSFSGSLQGDWTWNDPWSDSVFADVPGSLEPDSYGLTPALSASLFFDARPTETTRFYGSAKSAWPFETSSTDQFLTSASYLPDTNIDPAIDSASIVTQSGSLSSSELNIQIFELFSDFNWDDKVFFRFGKQTISWGVGYFFSPADVLNIQSIDPENPTAQREGPVSIRAHYPIPGSQNNLWAYAVFDDPDMKPEDTALAAKAEFVLGPWELGVGGWYRYDSPLRGMLTASGSVGQVSLFGEASLSLGTERKWVDDIAVDILSQEVSVLTREDDSGMFFKGSAGFSYANDDLKLSITGQYLYDAEGYADDDRDNLISEAHELLDPLPEGAGKDAAAMLFKGLIINSGRHYAAVSLGRTELFTEDLSLNVFVMANLSDFSGFVRPGLSYQLFDGASLGLSALFAFGPEDSEYIVLNDGPAVGITVSSTLGSGRF